MKKYRKLLALLLCVAMLAASVRVFLKPTPVLADSLFKFDEGYGSNINDSNQNVSAGTITGSTWKTNDLCRRDKCLFFDGSGDRVAFADDADLDFVAADNFTITGWFKHPITTTNPDYLVTKHQSTVAGGYKVYMDSDGDIVFGVDDDDTWDTTDIIGDDQSKNFDDNNWHFFAAQKDGTTGIYLYIDGNLIDSDTSLAETGTLANAASFYVGMDADGTSNGWEGFVDEVKVYRSLRTVAELKADYTGETPSRGTSASFGPDNSWISNGLVGYWKMDETSGNAADSSGNGLTLTNNATTTFVVGKFGKGSEYVPASSQYLSTATTISGVKSVSFWTNPDATTNYFVSLTSGAYITASSGTISATGFTNPKIYVNGIETSTIIADSWQFVTVTTEVAIDANQFYIGRQGSNYYDGTLDEMRTYNRVLSPSEASSLYHWVPGPIGHWKMDENTGTSSNDSSGNENALSFSGNPQWTTGKYGSGIIFAGSNQHILRTDDNDFNFGTAESFSYGAWIKHDTASAIEMIIDKYDTIAGNGGFKLYMEADGDVTCGIDDDETSFPEDSISSTAATYDDNAWHHVMCVKNGTAELRLYIDGILIDSDVSISSTGDFANADPLYIGIAEDAASNDWVGSIDDVRIYNYARKNGQVIEDMNAGHPAPGSPVGSSVAYWKFDEGALNTCSGGTNDFCDSSANHNDLTFSTTTGAFSTDGKFGQAFNGTGGAIRASRPNDTDLEFEANDDFSISLWFRSDSASNPAATEYLLTDGGPAGSAGYAVYADTSGSICFGIDDDTSWGPDVSSCTATDYYDTTWHHVTAVRNVTGDTTKIYVDAMEKDSDSDSTTATLDSSPTFYVADMDADDAASGEEFAGDIDELKIFSSAVYPDQIKILYNNASIASFGSISTDSSGNPSNDARREFCPPGNTEGNCGGSNNPMPVGQWKFDENTGTSTVSDTSGNGYALTITGSIGTFWQPCKFGSCMVTNNADALTTRVNVGDPASGDFDFSDTQDYTVSMWTRFDARENTQSLLYIKGGNSDTGLGYNLDVNSSNQFRCRYADGDVDVPAGPDSVASTTTTIDNKWHFVACVMDRDGSEIGVAGFHIFVDGRLENTTTSLGEESAAAGISSIQIGETSSTFEFGHAIDHVQVFRYARTPTQIAWEYGQGAPQGWWRFDENIGTTTNDASENGYASQTFTGSTTWTSGKRNTALTFDGTDDAVRVTEGTGIDFGATADTYTIAAWIKTSTNFGTNATIVAKDDGSGAYPFSLYVDSSEHACFQISDGTNAPSTCGTTAINDGTWHFITGKRSISADTTYIYVDGKEVNSTTDTTTATTANNDDVSFGNSGTSYIANDFTGDIDDVHIFRYAQSIQQIKTVMGAGAVRFGPLTGSP